MKMIKKGKIVIFILVEICLINFKSVWLFRGNYKNVYEYIFG